MKKRNRLQFFLLPVLLLCVCCSCASRQSSSAEELNAPSRSEPSPFEVFAGVEWGMTKEELVESLSLKEGELQEGYYQDALGFDPPAANAPIVSQMSYFLTAEPKVLGVQAYRVLFLFSNTSVYEQGEPSQEGPMRLRTIDIFYRYEDEESKRQVVNSWDQQYGPASRERIYVSDSEPKVVHEPQQNLLYWYGEHTYQTALSAQAQEVLRQKTIQIQHLDVYQDQENWNIKSGNSYLTEVYLNAQQDSYFNLLNPPDGPYLEVRLDGSCGLLAKIAEEQSQ